MGVEAVAEATEVELEEVKALVVKKERMVVRMAAQEALQVVGVAALDAASPTHGGSSHALTGREQTRHTPTQPLETTLMACSMRGCHRPTGSRDPTHAAHP